MDKKEYAVKTETWYLLQEKLEIKEQVIQSVREISHYKWKKKKKKEYLA